MSRTTEARAEADVAGLETISATDAIKFALRIEDHFNRLAWLELWSVGDWDGMHKMYRHFRWGDWRFNPNWRVN